MCKACKKQTATPVPETEIKYALEALRDICTQLHIGHSPVADDVTGLTEALNKYLKEGNFYGTPPEDEPVAVEVTVSYCSDTAQEEPKQDSNEHYKLFDGVEAKDVIKVLANSYICADMSPYEAWCFLTMMKYRLRIGKKDSVESELKKIHDYTHCLDLEGTDYRALLEALLKR